MKQSGKYFCEKDLIICTYKKKRKEKGLNVYILETFANEILLKWQFLPS